MTLLKWANLFYPMVHGPFPPLVKYIISLHISKPFQFLGVEGITKPEKFEMLALEAMFKQIITMTMASYLKMVQPIFSFSFSRNQISSFLSYHTWIMDFYLPSYSEISFSLIWTFYDVNSECASIFCYLCIVFIRLFCF